MRKHREKRGVSPVIATILLVGIVLVMGLIIFVWLKGLAGETITKFDKNADLVCGEIQFLASYSTNELSISNIGNVPIFQMKVKVSNQGNFETSNLDSLTDSWPESGLNQGAGFSDTITFSSAEKIVLVPVILGSSKDGEKTFICDEARFGYEISL